MQLSQVNNTGLVVPSGSATLITSYNLTFTTNAPEQQGINIRSHTSPMPQRHVGRVAPMNLLISFPRRFDVVDGPRYGRLERLKGDGRWVATKRFYSRQLEREKVSTQPPSDC